MKRIYVLILFLVPLVGCGSTVEYRHTSLPELSPLDPTQGVYHKVQKGETLWRIAQSYSVEIDDIIRLNNIPNAALIEENQLLFIPSVKQEVRVIPASGLAGSDDFDWPIRGDILTYYDQKKGIYRSRGIDIQTKVGGKVYASREGRVVFADYLNGYAQTVILDHQDGFFTVYGNNARLLVGLGDYVMKGQVLASIGTVGNKSYLHYEIRHGHRAKNPLHYLP